MAYIPQSTIDEYKKLSSRINNLRAENLGDKYNKEKRKCAELQDKVNADRQTLQVLQKKAKKDADTAKNIQKPGFKRFGARVSGKLDESVEKEKEKAEEAEKNAAKQKKIIAQDEKDLHIVTQAMQHLSMQGKSLKDSEKARKELIKKTFTGTVGSDLENRLENEVATLKPTYERLQKESKKMEKAKDHMKKAVELSGRCVGCMQEAMRSQQVDMVTNIGPRNGGVFGNIHEIRKQQMLRGAKESLNLCAREVDEARVYCPQIKKIDPDLIKSVGAFVDVFLDGWIVDAVQGKKLRASLERVIRNHKHLQDGLGWVRKRNSEKDDEYKIVKGKYKSLKPQLMAERVRLMELACAGQQWAPPTSGRMPVTAPQVQTSGKAVYPGLAAPPSKEVLDAFDPYAQVAGIPLIQFDDAQPSQPHPATNPFAPPVDQPPQYQPPPQYQQPQYQQPQYQQPQYQQPQYYQQPGYSGAPPPQQYQTAGGETDPFVLASQTKAPPPQQQPPPAPAQTKSQFCTKCGTAGSGKYCGECGNPM